MPFTDDKPWSQACENNKSPILKKLQALLPADARVLEIGSGTGQHAVHFAAQMPGWCWQTADQAQYHAGIRKWMDEAGLDNVLAPITLDVRDYDWARKQYDAVFTANTLHIMSLQSAQRFMQAVSAALEPGGLFIAYGPFNYAGAYTSESNARFDQWLKQQHPQSAIRDFATMNQQAEAGGLSQLHDFAMPANNRLLVWKRAEERSTAAS